MSEMDPRATSIAAQIVSLLERALALADAGHLTATAARIAHAIDTLDEGLGPTEVE